MGRARITNQRGQAAPEWLGLVLLVSLAMAVLAALGVKIPGLGFAQAVASRLVCAVDLGEGCGGEPSEMVLAYGSELAAAVSENTPKIDYEDGMRALPVDFRSCREDACAEGVETGPVSESIEGEPVTLFSHVVDCRDPAEPVPPEADCAGDAAGNLYLQYWAYYPGSQTSRALFGDKGFHPDDWESWQVRVGSEGTEARASSHNGYNDTSGDPLNDAGIGSDAAWTESTGRYFVAGGSHAGKVSNRTRVSTLLDRARGTRTPLTDRWTIPTGARVIPIESLRNEWDDYEFHEGINPPWLKPVYLDPEDRGT